MKMLFFATVFLAISSACGGTAAPEQIVVAFYEAYANADGQTFVDCMSSEAMINTEEFIKQLQETPEESAEYLADVGINVSVEGIANMTAGRFITAILTSPVYADELPDFSNAVFGETTIEGDRALVPVTIDDSTEEMELVLENGKWKIVGDGLEIL